MVNNRITANKGGDPAFQISTQSNNVFLANNIIWRNFNMLGNPTHDLNCLAPPNEVMTVSLSHNDIRIRFFNAQVNAVSETAAFNVDPNFISATNFGLRTGSHLIDQGDPNPSGGSIALDLAGKLRQERVVDIGAYEWQDQDNIFDSGFEL